jgi:F-type H+-transporting ATPase subunit delta
MILSSADFQKALNSPLFDKKSLAAAVSAIADKAKLQGVTKNFLNVLVANGRLAALPSIIKAFAKNLSEKRGNVTVDVTVAQDLSAKQKKDLEDALAKGLGQKVAVRLKVEPSILGGMIVTVGSKMIDDSVARKLERLRISLGVQANENMNSNSNLSEVV